MKTIKKLEIMRTLGIILGMLMMSVMTFGQEVRIKGQIVTIDENTTISFMDIFNIDTEIDNVFILNVVEYETEVINNINNINNITITVRDDDDVNIYYEYSIVENVPSMDENKIILKNVIFKCFEYLQEIGELVEIEENMKENIKITLNFIGEVSVEENIVSNLNVYPNPVRDIINIDFDTTQDVNITITDLSGRMIYNDDVNYSTKFDISTYPSGIYLVKVGNEIKKIVKH